MSQFLLGLLAGVAVGLSLEWIVDWSGLTVPGRRSPRPDAQKTGAQASGAKPAVNGPDARPPSAAQPPNQSEA